MPSINLAPGTQYIITARKRRVRLYVIAIGIALIFLLGWFGLFMYVRILKASSNDVKTQITSVDQKIQALHDEATRVAFFEKRLTDVSQILDTHIGWDKVFVEIERLLPADAVLTTFDAASDKSAIIIEGTTQNIDQIALALASLTDSPSHPTLFKKGTVKTIQRQEQKNGDVSNIVYAFNMTLEFSSDALSNKAL